MSNVDATRPLGEVPLSKEVQEALPFDPATATLPETLLECEKSKETQSLLAKFVRGNK